jgi:transposase
MAEKVSPSFSCPECNSPVIGFGKKDQLFMDIPMHGKRTGIVVIRKRYRCRECGKTFLEPLADMDEKRLVTKRLIDFIEKQSLKRTFVSISDDTGLVEGTIRNIFRDYVNGLEETVQRETPKYLGIDEIHIIRPRCVICNIKQRAIIDLLPNRNKDTDGDDPEPGDLPVQIHPDAIMSAKPSYFEHLN